MLGIRVVVAACLLSGTSLAAQRPVALRDSTPAWLQRMRALLDLDTDSARVHARALADSVVTLSRLGHDAASEVEALALYGHTFYNEAIRLQVGSPRRAASLDSAGNIYRRARAIARASRSAGLEGKMVWNIADVARQRGDTTTAVAMYRRALPLLRAAHDTTGEHRVLVELLEARSGAGDGERTAVTNGLLRDARRATTLGERRRVASSLSRLAALEAEARHIQRALVDRKTAIGLLAGDSLSNLMRELLTNVGHAYYNNRDSLAGGLDSAIAYYRRVAALDRVTGRNELYIRRTIDLADALLRSKPPRRDEAAASYLAAAAASDSSTNLALRALAHRNAGEFYFQVNVNDSAESHYRVARAASLAARDTAELLGTTRGLADVLDVRGSPDSALAYYRWLIPLAEAKGDSDVLGSAILGVGEVLERLDSLPQAEALYRHFLAIGEAQSDTQSIALALQNLGELLDKSPRTRVAAESLYWRVEDLTRLSDNGSLRVGTLVKLSNFPRRQKDWLGARAMLRRADSVAKAANAISEGSDAENYLSDDFSTLGELDSAIVWKARAAAASEYMKNHKDAADRLRELGDLYYRRRNADSAVFYYRRAASAASALQWNALDLDVMRNIGYVYSRLGLPDSALAFGERALVASRARRDSAGEIAALRFLSSTFGELGRPSRALELSGQAYALAVQTGDRSEQVTLLNSRGFRLAVAGRSRDALPLLRQALSLARALHDTASTFHTLHSIGYVFEREHQIDSASAYYAESIALRRAHLAASGALSRRQNLAIGLYYVADFVLLTSPDSALEMYREAATLAREVRDDPTLATSLRGAGMALARRRHAGDLVAAVAAFDTAASIFAFVRGRSGEEANRVSYSEQILLLYEEWTLAWLARANEVGVERAALAALAASERGRAQALLDLRRGAPAELAVGQDLAAEGRALVERVTKQGSVALVYAAARDSLVTWVVDGRGKVTALVSGHPRADVASLVAAFRTALGLGDAQLRARLASRSVPLEETLPSDSVVATPVVVSAVKDEASRSPVSARGTVSQRVADSLGSQLREMLVPERAWRAVRGATEVVLVPEGALGLLPFAALPIPDRQRYLGIRVALRYAPSLATLADAAQPELSREALPKAQPLVVGNPTMPTVLDAAGRRVTLSPLGGAEDEARWIADTLGTKALLGPDATLTAVLARLPAASIVHLATHGFAYTTEDRARSSFVALGPDSLHDGLLTVAMVTDSIQLHAELVVLSACQSGLGNLTQAEGTIGLQRAFLAKGARSVLVSLWSVSDTATSKLMKRFYTHWLADRDRPRKAEALRRAQDDLLRSGLVEPRYWAAFQLVGS